MYNPIVREKMDRLIGILEESNSLSVYKRFLKVIPRNWLKTEEKIDRFDFMFDLQKYCESIGRELTPAEFTRILKGWMQDIRDSVLNDLPLEPPTVIIFPDLGEITINGHTGDEIFHTQRLLKDTGMAVLLNKWMEQHHLSIVEYRIVGGFLQKLEDVCNNTKLDSNILGK